MPVVQIADVVVPAEFTAYQVENSMVSTALFQSGVAVENGEMKSQLQAGAQMFTVPFWSDLGEADPDITNDDPTILSTPLKITASKQVVRKSFLHQSWSDMTLASELSGDNALTRIQDRVQAYWDRTWERRLIASLKGVPSTWRHPRPSAKVTWGDALGRLARCIPYAVRLCRCLRKRWLPWCTCTS
jgi:hypothetical protein